jgi:hypothetical protein
MAQTGFISQPQILLADTKHRLCLERLLPESSSKIFTIASIYRGSAAWL